MLERDHLLVRTLTPLCTRKAHMKLHPPVSPHVCVENDSNELPVKCDVVLRQFMHACDAFSVFSCCVVSFLAT